MSDNQYIKKSETRLKVEALKKKEYTIIVEKVDKLVNRNTKVKEACAKNGIEYRAYYAARNYLKNKYPEILAKISQPNYLAAPNNNNEKMDNNHKIFKSNNNTRKDESRRDDSRRDQSKKDSKRVSLHDVLGNRLQDFS